jgi:competence protein ComEC
VTGTSHIVAVSGYNVAIVAGVVAFVGSRIVGWRLAVVPMIGAVLAYVVMTGLSPSAVRAGLMATLTFLAFAIPGRVPDPLTSLAVACGLIVMVDPLAVMDLGFQLSALATAGIVLFAVSREGGPSRLRSWVLAPLVVSLWAQIATLPIVLSTFHTLSLVSPLANLAIAAIVPGLMVSGCVLALLGAIPWIGGVVAGVTWVFATAIVWIVQGLATVPMAAIYVGAVPLALVAGWYAVLFVWVCVRSADAQAILPRRALVQLAVATTATVVSTSCVWTRQAESASSVTLLDVGAPAAFVRSAEGHTAVIGWSEASAFSLTASVAERFGLFERSLDVLIRTTEPTSGADGTSLLLQRYGATHCLGLGSDATPLSPGTEVVLGDTVIRVVDVRQHEGRAVADVAIVLGDSVVLLPGPGHATPALGDALGGAGSVVVRLPSRAMSWLRELSGVPVAVVVSDGTPTAVRGIDRSTPILTHRNHGSVTVTRDQWDGPFVRVERCTDGQDCGVTRAVSR